MDGPDTGRPARPHRKGRPGRRPVRSPRTPSLDPARASPSTYLLRPRAGPPTVVWARQAPLAGRRPMPRHPAPSLVCRSSFGRDVVPPLSCGEAPRLRENVGSVAGNLLCSADVSPLSVSGPPRRLDSPCSCAFAARRPSLSSALLSRLRACPRPAPWALLGRTTLARAPGPLKGRDVFSAPHRLCRRIRKNIASNPCAARSREHPCAPQGAPGRARGIIDRQGDPS